ncbi:molybdate ABC transporter substrate-binding protein [Alicyclobacillus sp.]|uniref:molybdate ABC transporter substrate-binding protein n=1 Tax=Alicyclobacillus sp. TaxID=61169 RepID=UPI0025C360CE|nr:molybdate ABC transporter substrate-binding protein [Alicyclobacillus sp.]MCL6518133.1 molybdate ABC transporter substrate-binding protein [Alicyclobacillus sp.]
MQRLARAAAPVACALALLAGCGAGGSTAAGTGTAAGGGSAAERGAGGGAAGVNRESVTLTVDAAASLTGAFQQMGRAFEKFHPGITVRFNFAGSQTLVTQMEQGAPVDVFASADEKNMDRLVQAGLADKPAIFAKNQLVIITPGDNPAGVHSYADLPKARRVVLGVPDVPIGAYARRSLQLADGVYGQGFSQRVMAHVVSQETDVKQIVGKVALGEADAAFVYRTDSMGANRDQLQVVEVPDQLNVIATYPIAVIHGAPHPDLAQAFVQFVRSAQGQAILADSGFSPGGGA